MHANWSFPTQACDTHCMQKQRYVTRAAALTSKEVTFRKQRLLRLSMARVAQQQLKHDWLDNFAAAVQDKLLEEGITVSQQWIPS